jgi:hypothetical protein
MKIKILEKCYTGTVGNMFAGEEHDMDDRIADPAWICRTGQKGWPSEKEII